ncbi:hypothetical protein HAX54_052925, partial [Datura stramonium]|nr:hypothetical protein [Datura stramonium]
ERMVKEVACRTRNTSAMGGARQRQVWATQKSQIPILLGTEAAKSNFNSRRNNE